MIKATCAVLANREIENEIARLAWDVHRRFSTGLLARRIPPHVSLKQPFPMENDLSRFEDYVKGLAQQTDPFHIELDGFFTWPGVFGISVRESPTLRSLHNLLNTDLPNLFGDAKADFDGDSYSFHVTVATGGASEATYAEIGNAYAGVEFQRSFEARELAIFAYDLPSDGESDFLMHTVLPLGVVAKNRV